tara:strand:+ start:369 stop:605 length:237 start_codon:yes stop_codon:yes gene_type:complete
MLSTDVITNPRRSGDVEEVKRRLAAGDLVNVANDKGITPLIYAANNGHDRAVQILLEVRKASMSYLMHIVIPAFHIPA